MFVNHFIFQTKMQSKTTQSFQSYLRFKYSLASVENFAVVGHQSSSQTKQ